VNSIVSYFADPVIIVCMMISNSVVKSVQLTLVYQRQQGGPKSGTYG